MILQIQKYGILIFSFFAFFGTYYTQCNTAVLPSLSNSICVGSSLQLIVQADSGSTFQWSPAANLSNTNNDTVVVSPLSAGTITYLMIATDTSGCVDSVYVQVSANASTSSTITTTSCDSYVLNGQTYTTSGNYTQYMTNVLGCDSIISLNLTINQSNTGIDIQTACDSYTWIDGITYTSSNNVATHTLTNAVGCDSVVTLNLTVNQSNSGVDVQTACDSYTWIDGNTYTSSNNIATHTLTNAAGCDSVVTLNLTVIYSSSSSLNITSCDNYTLNGLTYNTSGTYTQNLTNATGCDSTLTLYLIINNSNSSTTTLTVCDSLVWNGNTYKNSGNYSYVTSNVLGCDSTANLILTVNYSDTAFTSQVACDNFSLNSQNYTTSGTYLQNLTTANGCDSSLILNLTIKYSSSSILIDTVCDSLLLNSQIFFNSGTFQQIISNHVGCDSTINIDLFVKNSTTSTTLNSACDSLQWNGNTYTTSGSYNYVTTNAVGCDSTAYLDLTVNYSTSSTLTTNECINYSWNGTTYYSSGLYSYQTTNAVGCDSVAYLDLYIYPSFYGGTIMTGDILCKYDQPDSLQFLVFPFGGGSSYSLQWIKSNDNLNWSAVPGATLFGYQPPPLTENTYYAVEVTNLCGVDTTNFIFDSILPSPTMVDILGDSVFCANQHDNIFWINQSQPNIFYDWQVNGGVISQQISDTALAVDMDDVAGNVTIELHMTHNATGCDVLVEKLLTTSSNSSPNRTQVIRKPNSDILVCDDSTVNLMYQWGFTEKSSGTDTEITGGNLRYVLLPHSFDSTTYRYWVRTAFDYGGGELCETMSYLGPSPITNDEMIFSTNDLVAYPNPTTDFIQIPNAYFSFDQIWISDMFGRNIDAPLKKENDFIIFDLSTFSNGVYILFGVEDGLKFSMPIIKQ